jgi:hypothetical protein
MRIQRTFGGTTSPTSVFYGFVDVVTCGFAAALVLGIIFSIVQNAPESEVQIPVSYAYYEFRVSETQFGQSQRIRLIPIIKITAPDHHTYFMKIEFDARGTAFTKSVRNTLGVDVTLNNFPTNIYLYGFSIDFLKQIMDRSATPSQMIWGVLISDLPRDYKFDVQVCYADREDLVSFLPNRKVPSIEITRTVVPDDKNLQSRVVAIGDTTNFN